MQDIVEVYFLHAGFQGNYNHSLVEMVVQTCSPLLRRSLAQSSIFLNSCLPPNFAVVLFMSPSARFKRALVTLLLELARVYRLTQGAGQDCVHVEGEEAPALCAGANSSLQRRSWTQARVPTGYQEQGCCLEGLTEVALFEAPPSMIFCSYVSAGWQEAPQAADIVFRTVRR